MSTPDPSTGERTVPIEALSMPNAATDVSPPLTEQIVGRLGRPKWLWTVAWALVPLGSPFVFATASRLAGRPFSGEAFADLVATQVGLAYACLVLLGEPHASVERPPP